MRPRDRELAQQLEARLILHHEGRRSLPGINTPVTRGVFIEQLLESIHRVEYVTVIRARDISPRTADPNDEMFDPLKAAILHQRVGKTDEAFWLVFLYVHFGKHAQAGWRYAREVYGCLGDAVRWDWARTSAHPSVFRTWLHQNLDELRREGLPRGFGNHRKYQSLDAISPRGTGAAVESYISWVAPPRTHTNLMQSTLQRTGYDPRKAFHLLYQSMENVVSIGRMARFDYLTMVGKLKLAPIEPGIVYLKNSTGPLYGARLLFGGHKSAALSATILDNWLVELEADLNTGMQVLEDALCNWQKSPGVFQRFRG